MELRRRDLEAYDASERSIGYTTFSRLVGADLLRELNELFGRHPKFKDDYAVTYGRGLWRGKPCVCVHHSSIHHLWYIEQR